MWNLLSHFARAPRLPLAVRIFTVYYLTTTTSESSRSCIEHSAPKLNDQRIKTTPGFHHNSIFGVCSSVNVSIEPTSKSTKTLHLLFHLNGIPGEVSNSPDRSTISFSVFSNRIRTCCNSALFGSLFQPDQRNTIQIRIIIHMMGWLRHGTEIIVEDERLVADVMAERGVTAFSSNLESGDVHICRIIEHQSSYTFQAATFILEHQVINYLGHTISCLRRSPMMFVITLGAAALDTSGTGRYSPSVIHESVELVTSGSAVSSNTCTFAPAHQDVAPLRRFLFAQSLSTSAAQLTRA